MLETAPTVPSVVVVLIPCYPTLSSTGNYKTHTITNNGLAYENEPIATLTGGLAPYCHPKVVMTGPQNNTFANAGTETTVASIQLNPGKQINLWDKNSPDVIEHGRIPNLTQYTSIPSIRVFEAIGLGSGAWYYGRIVLKRVAFYAGQVVVLFICKNKI